MQPRLIVRRTAAALGILPGVFAAYRWLGASSPRTLAANTRARAKARSSGIPVPPGRLLYSVTTTHNVSHFIESGQAWASALRSALARVGRSLESMEDVLDFGCGCGRVLRQWGKVDGVRLHGCDYNAAGPVWVSNNLPWVSTSVNRLAPPLPYADGSFDFVYALSVFTHLPVQLQTAWMSELHRVIRPGGLLAITTMGSTYMHRLSADERRRFGAGEEITRDEALAGTNLCAAYHPEAYVRDQLSAGFSVVDFDPAGGDSNVSQDLYLLERHS